ncbi:MAG: L-aspartate oxidase [Verrucomicrobia bacterium]|nr:L-aspartate oxidase [Verrucomicrobiota bacterium]
MKTLDADYLVIGTGLAGLMSALNLSKQGHVIIVSKKDSSESNTNYAQGGIACPIDPDDTLESHVADTLGVGRGLCNESAVRTILSGGPEQIRELERLGISFARRPAKENEYDLGQEGGHSRRRVLHAGDITGHEVIKVLLQAVADDPRITLMENCMAVDLVTTGWLKISGESRCIGAYLLDRAKQAIFAVRASCTVLATGGAGKVYLYTSNPDTATGDGIAMAWRAGLPVKNMEFVQFHPTCLYHPDAKSFLISEAVRGEGAVLVNAAGEDFMRMYDERGALAPRDVVARAIDHEIKKRGDACVYLDITHKSREFLEQRFPNIYATCRTYGIDMATDLIPVVPAAHYCCGGVETDVDGVTALDGVYAVGEVACTGLHGANRLASNSLLEALVCAYNCATHIAGHGQAAKPTDIEIPPWKDSDVVPSDEAVVVEHNWNEVRTCMWDYVGIVRTNKRLERAARRVATLQDEIEQYYLDYDVTTDVLELRNIAAVAGLIIRSAEQRKESRGLHYTLDYPEPSAGIPVETSIVDKPGGTVRPPDSF